jgi:hypothetical protein
MSSEWIRQDNVVWEELGNQTVLVNPSARKTWVLNESAAFIWRHLNGSASIEDLARCLAATGGKELRKVRHELAAFCAQLEEAGMLMRRSSTNISVGDSPALYFSGAYLPPFIKMQHSGLGFKGRPSSRGITSP